MRKWETLTWWDNFITLISLALAPIRANGITFQLNYQLTDHIKCHSRNRCPGPFVVDLVEKKKRQEKKEKKSSWDTWLFDLREKIKIYSASGVATAGETETNQSQVTRNSESTGKDKECEKKKRTTKATRLTRRGILNSRCPCTQVLDKRHKCREEEE